MQIFLLQAASQLDRAVRYADIFSNVVYLRSILSVVTTVFA
eukprot:COSAG01_NODE_9269_length_2497_cov_3.819016_2_plen_41_part_00